MQSTSGAGSNSQRPQRPQRGRRGTQGSRMQGDELSWAVLDFVRRPPHWIARSFVFLLTSFVVLIFVFLAVVEVPVHIVARGRLVTDKPLIPVLLSSSTRVKGTHVRESQFVKRGTRLFSTDSEINPLAYESLKRLAVRMKDILPANDRAACNDCLARLTTAIAEMEKADVPFPMRESISRIQTAMKEYHLAIERRKTTSRSVQDKRAQIRQLDNKLNSLRRSGSQHLLGFEIEQLESRRATLESERREQESTGDLSVKQVIGRLDIERQSFLTAIDETQNRQSIVAPVDGYISDLRVAEVGQYIEGGQVLLRIVPASAKLVAELDILNKDIGRIHEGMAANIALDAFPESEFGAVEGRVGLVPLVAKIPANTSDVSGIVQSNYEVRVGLQKDKMIYRGRAFPLRVGMTLSGMITTRRAKLLQLVVEYVFNLRDQHAGG